MLVLLLTFAMLSSTVVDTYEFTWKDEWDITLFIVNDADTIPCSPIACTAYNGTHGVIWIHEDYASYYDQYGYSILYHELKHIECGCNWHEDLSWT